MKKINIVKKKYEFDNIIKTGSNINNGFFNIYYKKNNLSVYRFGVSVGKKLGNAVFRNRYKRLLRNIIDNNKKLYEIGYDYIIIMKKKCVEIDFNTMNDKFISTINKIYYKGETDEKTN